MLVFVAIMLNFLNFWRTCKQLPKKLQKRNNILKKIAGSDWGCSNGTLLLTYKAIFRSTLNYGAPICHLGFHNQHYKGTTCKNNKHCTSQSYWLCTIFWHQWLTQWEWNAFCSSSHRNVSSSISGSCYQSHRADHKTTYSTSFCPMRPTLNDTYRDPDHTHFNKDSKELGTPPSKIAAEEEKLPRIALIRIVQLRTGCCPLLNSYLSRICYNVDNRYPNCEVALHDVNHIFNCSINTTDLKVIDQRKRPVGS